jgi:glutaredoxin 3
MNDKIKVYSTQTCPYCNMVKEFLARKGMEFEDIDVGTDHEAAKEMISKTGQMGVPQIEINGRMIVGFNREAIGKEVEEMKDKQ